MMNLEEKLRENPGVTDYRINICKKKSYEMFFVKEKLETVRSTDTCDTSVTVYTAHDEFLGNADFFVYPSTTEEQLSSLVAEAVSKARLICNQSYALPEKESAADTVESNFSDYTADGLAACIANTVFRANRMENGALNAVEVFVNRYDESISNSRGLRKSQVRYDAMVEAIPTYNGAKQSVELYEQCNFSNLDEEALFLEIADKMDAVKARYEAVKPDQVPACKVIMNSEELNELFSNIASGLRYSSVYSHMTVFEKGKPIQNAPTGDKLNITMAGNVKGSVKSSKFDKDGLTLGEMEIVHDGVAVNYYGDNRYGQYLGEKPTGLLPCVKVEGGSITGKEAREGAYLEIISMSGLQVDFFSDYIGGEVRLACYHDGERNVPVTGISVSGSLGSVLNTIRLTKEKTVHGGYFGPKSAVLENMKIF